MNSPILEYIYQYTGIDPAYYILALAFLIIILIILMIVMLCKSRKLKKRIEAFLEGKDAMSLEETLLSCMEKVQIVDKANREIRQEMQIMQKIQSMTYQKMGIVKYDAFREMSGELSYAVVLLDQQQNGFVINSVYANEGNYSYIKEIVKGESQIQLSEEEQKALNKAKGID
ncbi:MAG: DUF4446 family protein [Lachnospiraceae bacterium]|nr:DUF4446 family protein [Lachnospiraceae bacterium]MCI9307818.1 DUF4446 family protein [Lachnospiraceae bacterium]